MQKKAPKVLTLGENIFSLKELELAISKIPVRIASSVKSLVNESYQIVQRALKNNKPIYGINTGFGYFANHRIGHNDLLKLQSNLVLSHASGYGTALSLHETRLAMILRLNVLIKGYTGVRYQLCEALLDLINAEIYPIIPEYGSVGASGDLAPLAHLALPLLGQGEVHYHGEQMPASQALKLAKLKPLVLQEKEGLSLINGTQIMLAIGGIALLKATALLKKTERITALTYEALMAHPQSLDMEIHKVRGQPGQIESAWQILQHLEGSYLFDSKLTRKRLQDAYSIRCAPQIHGASRDALNYATQVVERELNAVTDNPLVFTHSEKILSGGNFHGQALALAFDFASMAVSELANVSERRIEQLLNPHSSGLPAFLSPQEGLQSGYMAAQYLAAGLVNQNKLLANPACTDSIPGNVGIEDHVSMGMTSALKFKKIVSLAEVVLATEMLLACQAIDLREIKRLGCGTQELYAAVRQKVPPLTQDRIISEDIKAAVEVLNNFIR